jgi:hypothetical protein
MGSLGWAYRFTDNGSLFEIGQPTSPLHRTRGARSPAPTLCDVLRVGLHLRDEHDGGLIEDHQSLEYKNTFHSSKLYAGTPLITRAHPTEGRFSMPSRETSQPKMLLWGSERWQSGLMRRLLESRHADDTASGVQILPSPPHCPAPLAPSGHGDLLRRPTWRPHAGSGTGKVGGVRGPRRGGWGCWPSEVTPVDSTGWYTYGIGCRCCSDRR